MEVAGRAFAETALAAHMSAKLAHVHTSLPAAARNSVYPAARSSQGAGTVFAAVGAGFGWEGSAEGGGDEETNAVLWDSDDEESNDDELDLFS